MVINKYSRCWLPKINNKDWINKISKNNIFKEIFLDIKININIKDKIKEEILFFVDKKFIHFTTYIKESTLLFNYNESLSVDEFCINYRNNKIFVLSKSNSGFLYSLYYLLKLIKLNKIKFKKDFFIKKKPDVNIRMIKHWDNLNGSIKNGYSGNSIFFLDNNINFNLDRVKFYARLLTSIGINTLCINNDDVDISSTYLITRKLLIQLYELYEIFDEYSIKLFISVNYLSPIIIGGLSTFNPFHKKVIYWWNKKIEEIYEYMPNLGGFLIKKNFKDTESNIYDYDHANMIAKLLKYFDGILFWKQSINRKFDWRNKKDDKASYIFNKLSKSNGLYLDNVILEIKSYPIDFQIREPVSPLFGYINKTSHVLELQITQEYTGHQIDICFLLTQWRNILNFDTFYLGKNSTIKKIVSGKLYSNKYFGVIAISNIGDNFNWTGHEFAQLNIYGYGLMLWDLNINFNNLIKEWIILSFNNNRIVINNIRKILINSFKVYENYTTPLGIGSMMNPKKHYGPNVDAYEYSNFGLYHFSDRYGLGFDRTTKSGSNFISQYHKDNVNKFNNIKTCPEKLILFFHHLSYKFYLKKSKKTIIQYIYDTHFESVNEILKWMFLLKNIKKFIDIKIFNNIKIRIKKQYINACNWKDQINTYFFRKSGIKDINLRKIYK